ncbi:hypothetical protein K493DRAFT_309212 [Basidiobolus meristosporus CBS 931.73]|uniref:Late embryogenesis abundant protein LEA-2 subgroup domain-containing protein n=1 Tax=Basidiobolus meristosporus CBS 931.73 TaxID=1314790 RepID=A0A1Y1WP82_9FUNG|nr:hypothetical protein K493DRAFT_309212 [Basidiobolus meristosporus CBS 931.73]|eukprot:ORX75292.1 hypothetical protein K493DRAFT_309212 [Basidiobolus meristosporus CBS 931.73]
MKDLTGKFTKASKFSKKDMDSFSHDFGFPLEDDGYDKERAILDYVPYRPKSQPKPFVHYRSPPSCCSQLYFTRRLAIILSIVLFLVLAAGLSLFFLCPRTITAEVSQIDLRSPNGTVRWEVRGAARMLKFETKLSVSVDNPNWVAAQAEEVYVKTKVQLKPGINTTPDFANTIPTQLTFPARTTSRIEITLPVSLEFLQDSPLLRELINHCSVRSKAAPLNQLRFEYDVNTALTALYRKTAVAATKLTFQARCPEFLQNIQEKIERAKNVPIHSNSKPTAVRGIS